MRNDQEPLLTNASEPVRPPGGDRLHPGSPPGDFAQACRHAVGELRASLLHLYEDIAADPSRPQEVARQFNLNKNLTWKIARLIQAEDGLEAVAFIPGPGALDILLEAAEGAGASSGSLARAREAIAAFNDMVRLHAGDRADLELLLDASSDRPLAMSRRLGFRSNAGLWGLQAKVRLTAQVLAPSARQGHLDAGVISGLVGVRRLRSIQRWPLFRFSRYNDDASAFPAGSRSGPILPTDSDHAASSNSHWEWLLPRWSSPNLPILHAVIDGDAVVYELGDGPIGRMGEFSCFFGILDRAVFPRFRDSHNQRGEMSTLISLPIETLVYDVYFHRSLVECHSIEARLFGRPSGVLAVSEDERERQRLPMGERIADLGGARQNATPLVPHLNEMIPSLMRGNGWNPDEFVAKRIVLEHPPMPSTVMLLYELPEAPSA